MDDLIEHQRHKDRQGKINGQSKQVQHKGIFYGMPEIFAGKYFFKHFKSNPGAFQHSLEDVIIFKCDCHAIHRDVFEYDVVRHNREQHEINPFEIPHQF